MFCNLWIVNTSLVSVITWTLYSDYIWSLHTPEWMFMSTIILQKTKPRPWDGQTVTLKHNLYKDEYLDQIHLAHSAMNSSHYSKKHRLWEGLTGGTTRHRVGVLMIIFWAPVHLPHAFLSTYSQPRRTCVGYSCSLLIFLTPKIVRDWKEEESEITVFGNELAEFHICSLIYRLFLFFFFLNFI